MKLSTKGRYGLRAMVDLAANLECDREHVSLSSIAERQNISLNYLEQVFSVLRKAGFVRSVKGAQGGYVLTDKPENISAGAILRALEGDLEVVEKTEAAQNQNAGGGTLKRCIEINIWDKMNQSLNQMVDSLSLQELVNEYARINTDSSSMYYI